MANRDLFIGIALLLGAGYYVFSLLTKEFEIYLVTGTVLLTAIGIAFIRRSRKNR